jgi:ABC-type polysaccharide/polyol phosphate transport system ATPase subunit
MDDLPRDTADEYAALRERAAHTLAEEQPPEDVEPNGDGPATGIVAPYARESAIVIEHLSKRYRARPRLPNVTPTLFGRRSRPAPVDEAVDDFEDDELLEEPDEITAEEPGREVWALRDISLEIPVGTSLGVIGPNGAGKTTLLKILGRVTPPTEGQVTVRGRVAPMLTVANSMLQADFTARENVFLLGRFLGVPREVAERRAQHVLSFAELEPLAKVSVGQLSSGQSRRLGFSIMLNLEPDILLADETLDAGDPEFMTRCWEALEEARERGLTIVQVSHDMDHIRRSCDEALWIERGEILERGPADDVASIWEERIGRRAAKRAHREAREESPDEAVAEAPDASDPGPIVDEEPEPVRPHDVPAEATGAAGPPKTTPPAWHRGKAGVPYPEVKAELLIPFLRVAHGEKQLRSALKAATRAAIEAADERVRWWHLSDGIGMKRAAAEQVVERLVADAQARARQKRMFNEHVAIVGAGIYGTDGRPLETLRVDEPALLEIWLEAATVGVQFGCTIELVAEDAPTLRVVQVTPHIVKTPGSHRVTVPVPPGLLGDGQYRGRVLVRTFKDGEKNVLVLQDALSADVYDPQGSDVDADDEREDRPDVIELTDLVWSVKR